MFKYILFVILFIAGCSTDVSNTDNKSSLPVKNNLPVVQLQDLEENEFLFSDLEGKVIVLSFIYTNCPDICHITSSKLNLFKNSLDNNLKENLYFISISFDPDRDTPEVLKKHVQHMNLDLSNWIFVTGNQLDIKKVLNAAGIEPIIKSGPDSKSYTYSHRDRISLVDQDGQIRKHYKGTNFDETELSNDIQTLL